MLEDLDGITEKVRNELDWNLLPLSRKASSSSPRLVHLLPFLPNTEGMMADKTLACAD